MVRVRITMIWFYGHVFTLKGIIVRFYCIQQMRTWFYDKIYVIQFRMRNDIYSNVLCLRSNPLDAFRSKRCKLVFIQIYTFSPIIGNANHPS